MGMAEDRTMARFYSMTMKSDPYALNFQSIDGISSPNNVAHVASAIHSLVEREIVTSLNRASSAREKKLGGRFR
ncbi:hypothetical protein Csa_006264 [Cucumis sativus]|nr:hypothetical protein Csa_006264 [Cucumis sativus]